MADLPTNKLVVKNVANAHEEIIDYAAELEAKGERAWFELWYPKPAHFEGTDEEWEERQADTYDAVEVKDGEIFTLLPYAELQKEAS